MLEHFVREDLNKRAPRVMAVLRPLKVVIDNYPEGQVEEMDAVNNPEDAARGHAESAVLASALHRAGRFPRRIRRSSISGCRRGARCGCAMAYFITCTSVVKNEQGEVVEVHCTYDPATRGGNSPDGRKVKSTIHWVSAEHAVDAEVRIYENLFSKEDPNEVEEGKDFTSQSESEFAGSDFRAKLEPSLANAAAGARYQFERLGYFCVDPDSKPGKPVFNRTVALKDAWAKVEKKQGK